MIIKLRNRLTMTIMIFISVIMLLAFTAIYVISYARIRAENQEKLSSLEKIEVTEGGNMLFNGKEITDAVVINRISPALGIYFNLLADENGNLIFADSVLNYDQDFYYAANEIATARPNGGITQLEDRTWQYILSPASTSFSDESIPGDLTHIRFLDVTDSAASLKTLALSLIVLYLVLMLVFGFLARYFANRSIRPMAEAWESQQQFIADASHELKTPMSTLNTNLDILYASQEDTVKEQIKWLDNSKKVLARITVLIKDMLELAKIEQLDEMPDISSVDVRELFDAVIDYFSPAANAKQIEIVEDIQAELDFYSNHNMIQQVIEALLDNAVKYTNEGGQINICSSLQKNSLSVKIKNTGPGIAPVDINKIFNRFYRGDKARVYDEGSYGLGLSISKSAVQRLGGAITVESNTEVTTFTLKIPNKTI